MNFWYDLRNLISEGRRVWGECRECKKRREGRKEGKDKKKGGSVRMQGIIKRRGGRKEGRKGCAGKGGYGS